MPQDRDFFDMSAKQSMVMGLAIGIAAISTIGFLFIVSGGTINFAGQNPTVNNNANTGTPTAPTAAAPAAGDPTANLAAASPVTNNDHIRGSKNAKVTLLEYSDFQCPFCGQLEPTLEQLMTQYGNDIRLVYRHFPLTSIHPYAQKAAEASECASEQGKFWEMHDLMFKNQTALTITDLKGYAKQLGLNQSKFDSCLDDGKYASLIGSQASEAQSAGITGTPGTFVGDQLVRGAYPIGTFQQIIDGLLKK